ncbi:MAG: hypothetical protein IJB63_09035 [Alistipes sp.]|nr:hypothetical protein [Alistipes sp.]
MKKSVFLVVIVFSAIMMACQPANEKKALALINEYMQEYLYDYKSYEPIFVKIDTAYNRPIYDENVVALVKNIIKTQASIDDLEREIEWADDDVRHARSSMAIWNSAYTREHYNIAVEEYNEALSKLNNYKKEKIAADSIVIKSKDVLKELIAQIDEGVCGWSITHNYKCKSRGGTELSSQSIFIMDEDFTQILCSINEENMLEFVEIAEKLAEILGEVGD